mmetsp:Transcript_28946/g.48170  ORF Transcript_28946/g.48170 Transcript_28946/m.48170 type:complete len:253 (-) Transcript_28946:162-920(-)
MARAGDSTDWTKVTPAISCMISGTSLGLVMAVKILPVMCSISLLPITSKADFMVSVDAVLTCFLVSHMHAVTSGTTKGRASPSCLGATSLNLPKHCRASSRICHFFSTGNSAKIVGSNAFMAKGLTLSQIAKEVSFAAACTSLLLATACSKQAPKHSLVKGWAVGHSSARVLTVFMAAKASASSLEPHRAAKTEILAAKPDFSTPSDLTLSTTDDTSSIDNLANISSRDIMLDYFPIDVIERLRIVAKIYEG